MKLKRLTALFITGVLAFSNVAYATDDAAALLSTADATKDKVESELLEETDNATKDSSTAASSKASSATSENSLDGSNSSSNDDGVIYENADALTDPLDEAVIYEEDEASLEALEDAEELEKAGEDSIFDAVDETEPETVAVEPVFDMMDSDKEIELWEMLDGSYEELVQSYEVTVPENTEFPVTITFDALVEADDDILVYHFMEDAGEWETIEPDSVEDGFVTATFNSLSPVGIVKIDDEKRDIVDTLTYQEFTEYMDGVEISVSGEIPEGYYLTVEALPTSDYADMITEATGNVVAVVYDIKITDGENEYQPSEYGKTLSVTFTGLDSVNEGRMNVVHIDEESGSVEQKSATVDTMVSTSEVSFETDSFSPYALVIATSRLEIEEGIDATLPFVDDYYGTTTSKIYHMYLTYNSSEKEAFCLDHGLAASTGDTFVQNGQYASSSEVQKILTAYFADENGNGYTLSYSEAQVLIWAAMAGYDTTSDTDSNGTLDYVQIMQAVGDNDVSTNATAVATIEGITTYGTFYAWDPSSTYDESAGTYSRDTSKQRFVTLLGKAPVTAADVGTDELWQVGDNAYAYIDDDNVFHVIGYGDCWDQTYSYSTGRQFTNTRGFYAPAGEEVPYANTTICPLHSYTSIEIGEDITGIGAYMFYGLYASQANSIVFLGNKVTYIGKYAFYLAYLTFDDNLIFYDLEEIGDAAFECGPELVRIELNGDTTILGSTLWGPYSDNHGISPTEVCYNIKNSPYDRTNAITPSNKEFVLTIGEDVESIPSYIFCNSGVTTINWPTSGNLKTIGAYAFGNCNNLTEFTILESVENYGSGILGNSKNIETIYHNAVTCVYNKDLDQDYSDGVMYTTNYGIYGRCGTNNNDVTLIIGENVEALPKNFATTACISTVIDNSDKLTCYPAGSFYGITTLSSVTATNSNIETFYNGAFANCTALTAIDLSQYPSLTQLGAGCFSYSGLVDIVIPDTVTMISYGLFAHCTSLTSVTLGAGVEKICSRGVFYNDTALSEINYNCVNAACQNYSQSTTDLFNYATVGSKTYFLYTVGTTSSASAHGNYIPDHDTVLNIGPEVEVIPAHLFRDSDITAIDFSSASALTTIETYAFYNSPVGVTIDLPEGLTTIGYYAFAVPTTTYTDYKEYCEGITKTIVIPTTVTDGGGNAFAMRKSVELVQYNAINSTRMFNSMMGYDAATCQLIIGSAVEVLPENFAYGQYFTSVVFEGNGIDTIPANAFNACYRIASIELPEGVENINNNAFANCYALTDITLPDSLEYIAPVSIVGGAFWISNSNAMGLSVVDYDRNDDGTDDALTTTLHCSDDNMVARTYAWLSSDNRYVANALSYEYIVSLPMSLELTDPGDGIFINDLIVSVSVVQALDNPLSVVLSKGTFKNADNVEWTDWSLDKTSPSGTVKAVGDYSFDCTVSGTPPTDGSFTGSITCTVTE